MKKKLLLALCMTAFVVCLLTISVSAIEVDEIYYTINSDKVSVTVSSENRTSGTIAEVIIPETIQYDNDGDGTKETYVVTAIASSAFGSTSGSSSNNQYITSVSVPRTVATIGEHAFRSLANLKTVVIKASGYNLETSETSNVIFTNAEFMSCPVLESVVMSESNVTQVGGYAFQDCSALKSVSFSPNITSIGFRAFKNCSALESISSLETVKSIEGEAFQKCSALEQAIKLNSIESLSTNAFQACSKLTGVDMSGAPLTQISSYAFDGCSSLASATLPSNLKAVGNGAFRSCSALTSANIPRSIETVGTEAFRGAKFGGDLVFDNLTSLGQHAFRETNITSVVISGTITTTNDNAAFYECKQLKYVVLPSTVTTIGSWTFDKRSSLEYIVASENLATVNSIPSNTNVIIVGSDTSKVSTALSAWSVAPFSEYDPDGTATKTIFYGAIATDEPTVYLSFTGYDKSFYEWSATDNTTTNYEPVISALGYSTNPNGTGFSAGFLINHESLDAYEALLSKDVKFGIVLFNPKYIEGDSFFTNGAINASSGAVQVDADTRFSTFNFSITGFSAEHASLELVSACYAYTEDDASDIELIQKQYEGTQDAPVYSPMASKVSKNDAVLYTTKLSTVTTQAQITHGKDGLTEYVTE